jgi:hypothetical protein
MPFRKKLDKPDCTTASTSVFDTLKDEFIIMIENSNMHFFIPLLFYAVFFAPIFVIIQTLYVRQSNKTVIGALIILQGLIMLYCTRGFMMAESFQHCTNFTGLLLLLYWQILLP